MYVRVPSDRCFMIPSAYIYNETLSAAIYNDIATYRDTNACVKALREPRFFPPHAYIVQHFKLITA